MARRNIFRRIWDAIVHPEFEPPPLPPSAPQRARRYDEGERPQRGKDWQQDEAQRIWDDTVSDIVANPEMEAPFVKFVGAHYDDWKNDGTMQAKEVRFLISWLIVNANILVTHDDIMAILDRIYQSTYAQV